MKALDYFMEWYKFWNPAGYAECKCCGFTWIKDDNEDHSSACPVKKFKEEII